MTDNKPNPCNVPGHEGQWVEDKDSLSHLDGNYQEQIKKGMFNEYQVDSLRQDNSYCRACAALEAQRLREKQIETKAWNEALAVFAYPLTPALNSLDEWAHNVLKAAMTRRNIPITEGQAKHE